MALPLQRQTVNTFQRCHQNVNKQIFNCQTKSIYKYKIVTGTITLLVQRQRFFFENFDCQLRSRHVLKIYDNLYACALFQIFFLSGLPCEKQFNGQSPSKFLRQSLRYLVGTSKYTFEQFYDSMQSINIFLHC